MLKQLPSVLLNPFLPNKMKWRNWLPLAWVNWMSKVYRALQFMLLDREFAATNYHSVFDDNSRGCQLGPLARETV